MKFTTSAASIALALGLMLPIPPAISSINDQKSAEVSAHDKQSDVVRGTIAGKSGDRLVVKSFDDEVVKVRLTDGTDVTLNGRESDDDVLQAGFIVRINLAEGGRLQVADSVMALSPK